MTRPALTLDAIRAITNPAERGAAVAPYITAAEQKIQQARVLRAEAIVALLEAGKGVTETARLVGVSVSTVTAIRGVNAVRGGTS